jgi:hypothetical protein
MAVIFSRYLTWVRKIEFRSYWLSILHCDPRSFSRTGYGFQIAATAAVTTTWFLQQPLAGRSWLFWLLMVAVATCFCVAIFVNTRELKRVAARLKEIEHKVNSRAGEHLLAWETLCEVLTKAGLFLSFFSVLPTWSRDKLPPLDSRYLKPTQDRV